MSDESFRIATRKFVDKLILEDIELAKRIKRLEDNECTIVEQCKHLDQERLDALTAYSDITKDFSDRLERVETLMRKYEEHQINNAKNTVKIFKRLSDLECKGSVMRE